MRKPGRGTAPKVERQCGFWQNRRWTLCKATKPNVSDLTPCDTGTSQVTRLNLPGAERRQGAGRCVALRPCGARTCSVTRGAGCMAARPLGHGRKKAGSVAGRRTGSMASTRPSIRPAVASFGSSFNGCERKTPCLQPIRQFPCARRKSLPLPRWNP